MRRLFIGAQAVILFVAAICSAILVVNSLLRDGDTDYVVPSVYGIISVTMFYAAKSVWRELDYE